MTRILIVPSPSLSPLSTGEPIPTDGQMQSCPHLEWVEPAAETDYRCCDEQTPWPFRVAVWQEVAKPDVDQDEGDCIGPDCDRRTSGWFVAGDWGPGWYCGWCEAVPSAVPTAGAVVATVEVTGKGHDPDAGPFPGPCITRDITDEYVPCHPDALPDCWHTPASVVSRLDVPIPMERPSLTPTAFGPTVIRSTRPLTERSEPASWWWADIDLEASA